MGICLRPHSILGRAVIKTEKSRQDLGSRREAGVDNEGKEERSYWWRVLASEMGFLADLRGLAGKREREEEAPTEAERIMKQASCTWPGGDASESEGDLSVDWDLSIISGGHFYMDLPQSLPASGSFPMSQLFA